MWISANLLQIQLQNFKTFYSQEELRLNQKTFVVLGEITQYDQFSDQAISPFEVSKRS